jgi:hypothetical protein
LIAIHRVDTDASQIKNILKSIKDSEGKSHSVHEFSQVMNCIEDFQAFRNSKEEFHFQNITSIPILLTKVCIELLLTDPISAALALIVAMLYYDTNLDSGFQKDNEPPALESFASKHEIIDECDTSKTSSPSILPKTHPSSRNFST